MAPFLGLRGRRMGLARILMVVLPAFLLFGYNQSQIGGVLNYPSFTSVFPLMDTKSTKGAAKAYNATIQGTVVAIYTIGCLFGALSSTITGNRLGRRKSLLIFTTIATVGHVLQSSSYSMAQLIVGRIVTGLGVGGVNAIVPVWQSECSKPKNRGRNVVVLGIFIATGQACAAWVNYGLGLISENSVAWRLPLALPIIFTATLSLAVFCFPESPRWLVQKGRLDEACKVKAILDDVTDMDVIQAEVSAIQASYNIESQNRRGWRHIFASGGDRLFYRACLAIAVNFCAQMTGANAISYYATTIFEDSLDFPSRQAAVLAAGLLSWKILSSSVSLVTVDRFGRKPLFISAGAGMCIAMACLAITVSHIQSHAAASAAVFFLFLYMTFFPVGFLGANFLYSSEIAPQDLRVHFAAIGTATHWLFNFVIAEITPICFTNIGYQTYIIYAVISASVVPMVWFTFPETSGRSLDDMHELFSASVRWWQVTDHERKMPPSGLAQLENSHDPAIAREKAAAFMTENVEE